MKKETKDTKNEDTGPIEVDRDAAYMRTQEEGENYDEGVEEEAKGI